MSVDVGRRWRRKEACSDEGAAVLEYVGITIAIAALAISLIALFTPIGKDLSNRLCEAVSSVTGGGSCSGSDGARGADGSGEKAPPKTPCVQGSSKSSQKTTLSISILDGKNSGTAKMDRLSDGTYVVTVTEKLGLDAVARSGGVSASLKDKGIDIGASASAGGSGGSEAKYIFTDQAEAQKFMDWATGRNKANMVPVIGGFAYDAFNWLFGGYDPPEPSSSVVVVEGGVAAQASAGADFGPAKAKAEGSVDGTLGATIDTVTGEVTTYAKASLSVDMMAEIGLTLTDFLPADNDFIIPSASTPELKEARLAKELLDAGIEFEATERTTYDADGNVIKKSLILSRSGGINSPLIGGTGRGGVIYTAEVPVNDQNRRQVEKSGWPWVNQPFKKAVELGGDSTKTNETTMSGEDFNAKVKAEVTGVGGLGLSVQSGSETSTTTDASYMDHQGKWVPWSDCH